MATGRDIITGAYRKLGLLPLGANLDPDRAVAGLAAYNDMLNAWAADGIVPEAPYPPAAADPVGGDFINGGVGGVAYPPYGPGDASTPSPASALSLTFDDPFPFPAQFEEGAKAMLAVELASQSGIEPLPSIEKRARKAHEALLAYFVIAPRAGQDKAVTWMPSLRRNSSR
jgi:hypothetical protein